MPQEGQTLAAAQANVLALGHEGNLGVAKCIHRFLNGLPVTTDVKINTLYVFIHYRQFCPSVSLPIKR